MTEQNYQPQINLTALETGAQQRWVLRMLFTLAVLGAVIVVVVYHSWFRNLVAGAPNEVPVNVSETTAEKSRHVSPAKSRRTRSKHHVDPVVQSAPDEQMTLASGIVESTMRSPLAVEVVSGGGRHDVIGTRDDAVYLNSHDYNTQDKALEASNAVGANAGYRTGEVQAAARARVSSDGTELASLPVRSVDPLLGKQQMMEGVVVLLAQIDKEGNIESLQPITGSKMFFTAAVEAVKQWRFKPYYQSGQAVDSEAQITVRFAISAR
jgi:TonB family protein